jgi:hypothetical protein
VSHREIVLVTIQDGCKGFVFPFTEEQVANLEIIANISTSVSIVALTIHGLLLKLFLCDSLLTFLVLSEGITLSGLSSLFY